MKKFLILGFALCMFSTFAHFPIYVKVSSGKSGAVSTEWSPVQIGVYPGEASQLFWESTEIYGLSFGLLALQQKSSILSFSLINALEKNYLLQVGGIFSVTENNYALSISPLLNMTGRNYGIQAGLINMENNFGERNLNEKYSGVPGLQIGLFNVSGGWQIGLLNFNPQGLMPYLPLINFPVRKK